MAIKAYVLIEVGIGKTKEVTQALQKIAGVKSVDAVTGPYDVIAQIEGASMNTVGDLITKEIHAVSGLTKTTTCVAVKVS